MTASGSGETGAHDAGEVVGDPVGLGRGGRLDHHADQWFGPARSEQHAARSGEFRFEPVTAWWGEGTNVVEVRGSAVGTGSGVPIEWNVFVVNWLRGDKVARTEGFLDRDEAIAAAGPVVPY